MKVGLTEGLKYPYIHTHVLVYLGMVFIFKNRNIRDINYLGFELVTKDMQLNI